MSPVDMAKFGAYTVPDLTELRAQLRAHYARQWSLAAERHPVEGVLDAYAAEHPDLNAYQLKAAQYRILADHFNAQVFDESPFYFIGDYCRGVWPGFIDYSAGAWMMRHNMHILWDGDRAADHGRYMGMKKARLFTGSGLYFDVMHYCFPIENVVKNGLRYYYEQAQAALSRCETDEQRDFVNAALTGLLASKQIAERFGQLAQERLAQTTDPHKRRFLSLMAEAAPRTPWEKPAHFWEGLNTLWFCRDMMCELDGAAASHLGRVDLILKDLYDQDLASGYMTKDEMYDLVSRFMQHGDCQYDRNSQVLHQNDHELEMGFVLGGCDRDGKQIYNEISEMFLHAHRAQNVIYPKPHCRFGEGSSEEYLENVAVDFVNGRSVSGLINDDSLIPALVNAGKSLEDARCYINYGCWGICVEGMENVTGGNFIHLLSMLERSIYGDDDTCREIGVHFNPIDDAQSFEEVFDIYYENTLRILRDRLQIISRGAKLAKYVNPIPLFSICMDGPLTSLKDVMDGGSKYQTNDFALAELSNTVDALLAIKHLCFVQKKYTLREYLDIVRSNWEGHEALRLSLLKLPHYGDESEESMALTRRLFEGIYNDTRDIPNEFGTEYLVDLFVYQEFRFDAEKMLATPDGRRNGDIIALGANPARLHHDALPCMLNSITAIDPVLAETHSVTLQLPAARMSVDRMVSLIHAMQKLKMKHIQINCVDMDTLLDAQKHPENHQDLVVRICGFSAKFVCLSPEWQDEFINRVMYDA